MSKSTHISLILLLALTAMLLFYTDSANAADRMTFEEYQIQLQKYQEREAKALEAIENERAAIDELHARIAEIEAQIEAIWNKIYALLNVTKAEIQAFLDAIGALEDRVNELAQLSPDRLLDRTTELDELGDEVKEMQSFPIALLSEPRSRLSRLATRIEALKRSLPKPKHDMYHVLRGDYLWKISGRQVIFNDPWKWMRIYSANRDEIKDPDLIYPDQMLRIPRQIGRDEHLVMKGDFLRKIAGYAQVYSDPFQWTKIYQANKTIIQDPNLIYPEQILIIPRN